MPTYLYENSTGRQINRHSYSSGSVFNECPTKWNYQKRLGWKEKNRNAAPEFGKCFEDAIRFYHLTNLNLDRTISEFNKMWRFHKEDAELKYKDKDSWESMYWQGVELLKLYAVRLPNLPIVNPQFQLNYHKELFPETEYAGIEDGGFVDMQVDHPPKNHLLLPSPAHPENGQPLIIDIKTSGKPYPANPKLLRLDPQLRRYSWLSGIETVAFMVFVRGNLAIDRGDEVTLLIKGGEYVPGQKAVVFDYDAENDAVRIMSYPDYSAYKDESKGVMGNALKAIKAEYAAWKTSMVRREDVAAQEIQFLTTVITDEDRRQAGNKAASEAVEIVRADRDNDFPQHPGIRFPAAHCTYCAFLGLCIDDQNMVESKLVNISNLNTPLEEWEEAL